jgi:hypothetical protein
VIITQSDHTGRSGVIQPDGTYTVEDVRPGRVNIAVASRDPSKARKHARPDKSPAADKGAGETDQPAAPKWFPIPRVFEDPEKSGLGCTIEAGRVTHDIEMK